jgi:hypothetical protein
MKKCALASALVLAISTVTWGIGITGIDITQACSLTTIPSGLTLPLHQGVHSWVVDHVTDMYGISTGCHNTCVPHCWPVFEWPCHQHCGDNSNSATSANSSSSTIASGPHGDAVANSSSSATTAHSSSTSSSHSQSTAN